MHTSFQYLISETIWWLFSKISKSILNIVHKIAVTQISIAITENRRNYPLKYSLIHGKLTKTNKMSGHHTLKEILLEKSSSIICVVAFGIRFGISLAWATFISLFFHLFLLLIFEQVFWYSVWMWTEMSKMKIMYQARHKSFSLLLY